MSGATSGADLYILLDTALVPPVLRGAISPFTRVFDALCLCGVVRC
jgi:hypothetical protein